MRAQPLFPSKKPQAAPGFRVKWPVILMMVIGLVLVAAFLLAFVIR